MNFGEIAGRLTAEEAKPRTKAEVIEFLESEGDRFAAYVEGLSESFLAEQVKMPPGAQPATKSRFEMLLSPKEHEMHHRASADADRADARHRAALDAPVPGADGRQAARQTQALMPAPRFSPKAIAFLRSLKRNNKRDWFQPRKEQYETLLRRPMLELIERLAIDFKTFAPELEGGRRSRSSASTATRGSPRTRSPYKTQVSAVFPHERLAKLGGGVLYLEVAAGGVWAGGGIYRPDTSVLQAEREHIAVELPAVPHDRRVAGVPAGRGHARRRRPAAARAARVSRRTIRPRST